MGAISASSKRFAVLLTVFTLLLPGLVVPTTGVRAQSGNLDELAYSPQTGYFFFWDPARLSLHAQSSETGIDWWLLSDGESTVNLWAYSAPGVTVADCASDYLDRIAADPATVSLAAMPIQGGGPVEASGGETESWAHFVLTVNRSEGQQKFAATVFCQQIVPAQSLLLGFELMPARVFNEQDLLFLYLGGFGGNAFQALRDLEEDSEVASIADGPGNVVGTLAAFLPCNTTEFDVLARGWGDEGDFAVGPSSFIAFDENGVSLPVTAAVWSLPAARRQAALALGPNEIGLVHGAVDAREHQSFDLYYLAPSGEAVFLAEALWGCGAGGAAPVPIDIE